MCACVSMQYNVDTILYNTKWWVFRTVWCHVAMCNCQHEVSDFPQSVVPISNYSNSWSTNYEMSLPILTAS